MEHLKEWQPKGSGNDGRWIILSQPSQPQNILQLVVNLTSSLFQLSCTFCSIDELCAWRTASREWLELIGQDEDIWTGVMNLTALRLLGVEELESGWSLPRSPKQRLIALGHALKIWRENEITWAWHQGLTTRQRNPPAIWWSWATPCRSCVAEHVNVSISIESFVQQAGLTHAMANGGHNVWDKCSLCLMRDGELITFSMKDGSVRWRLDLGHQAGTFGFLRYHGPSDSWIVLGNQVIMRIDDQGDHGMVRWDCYGRSMQMRSSWELMDSTGRELDWTEFGGSMQLGNSHVDVIDIHGTHYRINIQSGEAVITKQHDLPAGHQLG